MRRKSTGSCYSYCTFSHRKILRWLSMIIGRIIPKSTISGLFSRKCDYSAENVIIRCLLVNFVIIRWLSMIIHDYPWLSKKIERKSKISPNEVQFSIIQCKCKVNRKTLWTRTSIILIQDNWPEYWKGFESCTKTAIIINLRQITIKTKILKNRPKNHHLRSKSRSRNEVHFLIRPFLCLQ